MTKTKGLRQRARRLGLAVGQEFFLAAQCGLCPLCNKEISLHKEQWSFDHVHPLKPREEDGGGTNLHHGNLLLVHTNCNRKKSNTLPSKAEISTLAMVNDILGFNEVTGEYRRRKTFLRSLERSHQTIVDSINEMEEKQRKLARAVDFLEYVGLDILYSRLGVIEQYIDDQRSVFQSYKYRYG